MPMKDRDVQFFRPLWRRVAVTVVCAVWAGLEIHGRDTTWIAVSVGFTAYAVWSFFIRFPKDVALADAAAAKPAVENNGDEDVPPQG